jgi:hypothetical protein
VRVAIGGDWSSSAGSISFRWLSRTNTGTVQELPEAPTVLPSLIIKLLGILLTRETLHRRRILDLHLELSVQVMTSPKRPKA